MSSIKTFKLNNEGKKRPDFQQHHDYIVAGGKVFKSSNPCPKCGSCFRKYTSYKKTGARSSACNSCSSRKKKHKVDADAVKKRRAIELHQEKIKDFDEGFW